MELTKNQLDKLKKLAISSGTKHNLPNGALIISKKGKIIGASESLVATNHDATAHAERLVISKVCKDKKSPIIPGYILVTVPEPCLMCISASYWTGIKDIWFIVPSSRYFNQLPWIAESKKLQKEKLISQFEEKINYCHLRRYEKEFSKIFNEFIDKVIKRPVSKK